MAEGDVLDCHELVFGVDDSEPDEYFGLVLFVIVSDLKFVVHLFLMTDLSY